MEMPTDYVAVADVVPMGLLYLAEACRARGYDPLVVQLQDAAAVISSMEGGSRFTPDRWKDLLSRLLDEMAPTAVGIQCHWSYHSAGAFAVARWVKELRPQVHVTLGGVHAGAMAREILHAVDAVDAVVVGDGDQVYPDLLDALARSESPPDGGLVHRRSDGTVPSASVTARPPAADAVSVLSFDPTLLWPEGRGRYIGLPFMRGRCPKPCTFCSLNSELLYPVLEKSLVRQLEEQLPAMVSRRIPLYLPEHFAGPKPLEALARALEETGTASMVLVDAHPGTITDRAVTALSRIAARADRLRIWLGVEAGSERVRRAAGRDYDDATLLAAFDRLQGAGITGLQSSIMVGLPGETESDVMASDAMIGRLNEKGILANVLPVIAFPETTIFRDPAGSGVSLRMKTPEDFERLSVGWHAPIAPDYVSFESAALDARARVEATLKLRLRQRNRLGFRTTPELFRTMEHLPGLRVAGEAEAMVARYAPVLGGSRFGGPVTPDRYWSPEDPR
jgi:radical SAM superfamily enzyme YgiQ (UPF0313 family)